VSRPPFYKEPDKLPHLLSQTFKAGKRLKGEYVKVALDTRRAHLTIYRKGRVFKRWPYSFLKKSPPLLQP